MNGINKNNGNGDNRDKILDVHDLKTYFYTEDGVVKAVDGVDLHVKRGEVLGLVGESGCGKSVTSFSILRLVGIPGKIVSGEILFEGENLLALNDAGMRSIRGNRISMIFQQPTSCLNPVFKVGAQVGEVLDVHQKFTKQENHQRVVELLHTVGIPEPAKRANCYPHELSGGMAQRVMIAMALACTPELLIADEPTTALDVTIQAQVLDLLMKLREEIGTSIILITHDLGIVAETCERVAVMYAGRIVEETDVETLFANPMHPYTQGLIGSVPILGQIKDKLHVIPGSVPNLIDLPDGCKFAPRCRARIEHNLQVCTLEEPPLRPVEARHPVRCWLYQ
ncbi:MAG: ABC transporter ATP-binding protein [Anaerolineae bacterium]|jgi:oligopeptide/dipeptide ABC transporter ATP-binding protein